MGKSKENNKENNRNNNRNNNRDNPIRKRAEKIVVGLLLATMILATGCGSSSSDYVADMEAPAENMMSKSYSATDDLYNTGTTESAVGNEAANAEPGAAAQEAPVKAHTDSRKLIKTVSMDVETEEYDTLMQNVQRKIDTLGGYIASSSTGENGRGDDTRYATITAKVPAEKVDQFISEVSDISNVISKNETVDDVTLQYVDLESHKKALLTEQESLLKLMESATNMEDIIAIESRLSDVRYQLESMESQLRTFDDQVAYSEVTIYIAEVTRLTPMEEVSTWDKITEGFMDNVERVGKGIRNFFVQLLINLPFIFVLAVLSLMVFFIVRFIDKKSKKHYEKIMKQKKAAPVTAAPVPVQSYGNYADYADQRQQGNEETQESQNNQVIPDHQAAQNSQTNQDTQGK
ncbi:MAG: DUF4349 domain-containing protein [Lachnospiraceae bacterium]|nr:DUF4349 domain-containing protein [Lachnospiraceae bacterium]